MADDQPGAKLAEFLAARLPLTMREVFECEDAVTCSAAFSIAGSLLRHLGQEDYAEKLRDIAIALALDRPWDNLDPEAHQLVTVLLQAESKRRYEREREG